MGKTDRRTEQEKPSDRTRNQKRQDDAGRRAVKSKDRTKVACRQPRPSLLCARKNRSENNGTAHTTTGKNRNTCSMSNRDQTGGASGAEKGLHAEERRPEPMSGGKSEGQAEN
jgi:hypothetical protein